MMKSSTNEIKIPSSTTKRCHQLKLNNFNIDKENQQILYAVISVIFNEIFLVAKSKIFPFKHFIMLTEAFQSIFDL